MIVTYWFKSCFDFLNISFIIYHYIMNSFISLHHMIYIITSWYHYYHIIYIIWLHHDIIPSRYHLYHSIMISSHHDIMNSITSWYHWCHNAVLSIITYHCLHVNLRIRSFLMVSSPSFLWINNREYKSPILPLESWSPARKKRRADNTFSVN